MNSDSQTPKSIETGDSLTKAVTSGTCSTPFIENLARAGTEHDGHVTNGSLAAQVKIVRVLILALIEAVKDDVVHGDQYGTYCAPCTEVDAHVRALTRVLERVGEHA